MIDWTEIPDGDTWELFARDFLAHLGFVIEVDPGRGADSGRDLIVSEQLTGLITTRKTKWLVSCKHFARSNKSVGLDDELNISDRLKHHNADGFMGFYSTMASASLIEKLHTFKADQTIPNYEVFDGKKIESRFVDTGLSMLALRYIPKNYSKIKPIQSFFAEYEPLECEICGTDILKKSVLDHYSANMLIARPINNYDHFTNAYVVCKGECDEALETRLSSNGEMTRWLDIGDLCNPILYLQNMLTYMNNLHSQEKTYTEEAHSTLKNIYIALAQRTLREVTKDDKERASSVVALKY